MNESNNLLTIIEVGLAGAFIVGLFGAAIGFVVYRQVYFYEPPQRSNEDPAGLVEAIVASRKNQEVRERCIGYGAGLGAVVGGITGAVVTVRPKSKSKSTN